MVADLVETRALGVRDLIRLCDVLRPSEDPALAYGRAIGLLKGMTGARLAPTYLLDSTESELILVGDGERALLPPGFDSMPAAMHVRSPWVNDAEWPVSARPHVGSPAWNLLPEDFRAWFGPSGIVVSLHANSRHLGAVLLAFDGERSLDARTADFLAGVGRVFGHFLEAHRIRARERELGCLDERRRLGDELHADLSQDVAAVGLALGALRLDIGAGDLGALEEDVARMGVLVDAVQGELRGHMLGLRQEADIADSGLLEQARRHLDQFTSRTDIPVTLEAHGPDRSVPLAVASQMAHVLQEALNNVAVHARARQVGVVLDIASTRVRMEIRDDGCGFDPEQVTESRLGLLIMRERLAQIDGSLDVSTAEDGGTVVRAEAPTHPVPMLGVRS